MDTLDIFKDAGKPLNIKPVQQKYKRYMYLVVFHSFVLSLNVFNLTCSIYFNKSSFTVDFNIIGTILNFYFLLFAVHRFLDIKTILLKSADHIKDCPYCISELSDL